MLDKPGSASLSPSLPEIAKTFRLVGWVGFWVQLVLTVISSIILIFAGALSRAGANQNTPTTGIGVVVTVFGIVVLLFNMYWALFRYVPIGRKLDGSSANRPRRTETIKVLRTGLIAGLIGMLLSLLGAQATVGLLAAKAFNQGIGGFVNTDPSKFIQPLDILVVQASVNVILAQFFGIGAALWLLNRITR
jgi:preprotein translocase subunit Sss1